MIAVEERIVQKLLADYPIPVDGIDFYDVINTVKCRLITQAMQDAKNNVSEAARLLNMVRTSLNQIIVDSERKHETKRTDSTDDLRGKTVAWGYRGRSKQRAID